MNVDDMILVSIDDHVIEPRDMFDRHVPEKYRDQAPKSIMDENGYEKWWFQGVPSVSTGLNAVVGWPKEEWGMNPTTYAEMRPGSYDIHERVRDMNRNGILASMCFPSFAGFSARFFQEAQDKDLALIMLKAYNDWHIDEWAAAYPGRFIPIALGPVWHPEELAKEVRRVAAKGVRAMTMPELPHLQGLPSYHDLDYWDPFFRAASETQVVMCLHIGQGFAAIKGAPDAPIDNLIILATQVSTFAAQDLLWGGAMLRYPDLKIAWSEAGIGWIPFYLNRCDRHYTNQRWLGHDFGGKLPSDIFREHSLACYVTDPTALKVRHDIGVEIIAWECDYPHSDSIWPDAPEFVLDEMNNAGVPDHEINMITYENTCRFFGWDPFKHIPKPQATVGALRALSPDVDTTVRSKHEWRERYELAHSS
ncbi:putative TIM-barrel fold metal-dependent hydrolase [Thermocatellispora tengchongensis]|uniref:Putative TIM-barrel fold metal-dependent hydrolase n=1 Tax=Thermocatellispora tengchongensis TaxID=1073253 RepID=A0A840P7P8_9ACTN|nr:amidohydrolase family protein [Thermocatellispora tengchongensis]MBB5137374.1 putative TIM-barrel fold metal-dependent hydrolase [Thermocatellispora tengchongensis]